MCVCIYIILSVYKENKCLPKHVVLTTENLTTKQDKTKFIQNVNFNVSIRKDLNNLN